MHRILPLVICSILTVPVAAVALDQITINVLMPDLTCGKGSNCPTSVPCPAVSRPAAPNP